MEGAKAVEEAMRRAAMERAYREEETKKEYKEPDPLKRMEQKWLAAVERLPEPLRDVEERWLAELFRRIEGGGGEAAFANQVVANAQTTQSPYRNWTIEVAPSLVKSPNATSRATYLYYLPFNAEVKRERLAL